MLVLRSVLFLLMVFAFGVMIFGQDTNSNANQDRIEQQRQLAEIRRQQREYEQKTQRDLATNHPKSNAKSKGAKRKNRKYPSEKELAVMAPDAEYVKQFKGFLKSKKTGLTRLVSDRGCSSDTRIVEVLGGCIKYERIPGYGSTYSFRKDKFVMGRFADVVYKNGVLYSFGLLTTGFFTELGDVSVADVTNVTNGAKFPFSYIPKKKFKEIKEENGKFVGGITSDGFIYKKSARLVEGKTYLLRSIAYKAKNLKDNTGVGVFDNTSIDKRNDLIVALSVIEIDADGSTTLLWKIINEKSAPKIVFPKTSK